MRRAVIGIFPDEPLEADAKAANPRDEGESRFSGVDGSVRRWSWASFEG